MRAIVDAGLGPHDLASLDHLLEAPQVVGDLLARLPAKQGSDRRPNRPERRVIAQVDAYQRPATARRSLEAHRAGGLNLRPWQRAPGDQLIRAVLDDLGVPLEALPARAACLPVGPTTVDHPDRFQIPHESLL